MIDNDLSEYMWALDQQTPAKTWWYAEATHAAVARALRIDPKADGAAYALAPFRYCIYDGRHLILAAYPAPMIFVPDHAWFRIETVIAWNPIFDTATVLEDDQDQFVGTLTEDANTVFASPRAFFQAWAMRRAQFAVQRQPYAGKAWHQPPIETDLVPGALLIGDLRQVRLNPSLMPDHIECNGIDPREFNKAVMRSANLPRVSAATSNIRSAA